LFCTLGIVMIGTATLTFLAAEVADRYIWTQHPHARHDMPQPDTLPQRLDALLGALATPWEFANIDAGRDHIASSGRDAVGGQHSQGSLNPACAFAPV
jgi:hypothetical protein